MQALHAVASSLSDPAVRWSARDIPLSHARHICGRVAWTPPPQSIPVESRQEAFALAFLLAQPDLVAVQAQPFTLSYMDGGEPRRYTPDFLVIYDRLSRVLTHLGFGLWTVVEVKPVARLQDEGPHILRRLEVIHATLGFAAVCLTEREMGEGRAQS